MHRIGIISDTHGLLRPEVEKVLCGCEAILHGGDINSLKILNKLNEIAPTHAVRGNNDKEWAAHLPKTLSLDLYGVHFFMVHNKKFIPKDTEGIDVIVYGHSHKYEEKYLGGQLLLNPGSCGPGRFTQPATFAVMEIADDCSFRVEKAEISHRAKGSGAAGTKTGDGESMECQLEGRDMIKLVKAVMRDTDQGVSVGEIALKNDIGEELAKQLCRLYLTHPGVSAEGILRKMGL